MCMYKKDIKDNKKQHDLPDKISSVDLRLETNLSFHRMDTRMVTSTTPTENRNTEEKSKKDDVEETFLSLLV